jgi:hypothetical protein
MVMPVHSLGFEHLIEYDPGQSGITVETTLDFADREVTLEAKIDTGASICIFERVHGEALGFEIETGFPLRVGTATGSFSVFGFRTGLAVAGIRLDSLVYFAEDINIRRSVLGRHGWLESLRLGLIDYEGKVFLGRYS